MSVQIRQQPMLDGRMMMLVEICAATAEEQAAEIARAIAELEAYRQQAPAENAVARQLTPREYEIALLLCSGKRAKELCNEMALSENTVAAHVRNIYRKLGVHSRIELANLLKGRR